MLMTMEMWELGFYMDRWRLLLLLLVSFPVLMFLSHYSGFERTWGWRDDLRDVAVSYGVGLAASAIIMLVLGIIGPATSLSELIGNLVLQTIPAALGALLARSQFGQERDDGPREGSYGDELGVMAIGSQPSTLKKATTREAPSTGDTALS
jgi:putative integral membrane protein (TIGR02587 family)